MVPPAVLFQAFPHPSNLALPLVQRPELRGELCRLYSLIRAFFLVPGALDGGGGACPPSAAHAVAHFFTALLGGIAPLVVVYAVELALKAAFLRSLGVRASLGAAIARFAAGLFGAIVLAAHATIWACAL